MTKPDDVSQEDWDAVDHAFDEAWDAHGAVFNPASNSISDGLWARLVEASTRLIMAARLQERERAADIAYVTCAQTRHVRLGDEVAAAIRSKAKE